ncbi:MAG TPA: AbrB/MazE/SpoVT family DNA-binding domain-containing protein [Kiloniellales bacterium]|nr:AbrB/MazE/SpoVT family DNA-binding domain-containing protein [Kiloniellales bacterium]
MKLIKVGNSVGVILPKESLSRLNVTVGDTLILTDSPGSLRLSPYEENLAEQVDAGRRIMKKRRNALRELAK